MEWIEGMNRAMRHVEEHLTDDALSMESVARAAGFSPFYLQRMFNMMTDLTLSEYIRQRRLSMAGQELQATGAKVIDMALKYGYETPESFQKAFRRFHGVTPSAASASRSQLRYLNPLHIEVKLTGGTTMDYTIESMDAMQLMGMERRIPYNEGFVECPKLWCDYNSRGLNDKVCAYVGACFDEDTEGFTYMIGAFCAPEDTLCEGFTRRELPAMTWAKFRTVGAIPQSIHKLNRQIFTEWLPGNPDYEPAAGLNLEVYSEGDMDSPDYACEIWIPVRRKGSRG